MNCKKQRLIAVMFQFSDTPNMKHSFSRIQNRLCSLHVLGLAYCLRNLIKGAVCPFTKLSTTYAFNLLETRIIICDYYHIVSMYSIEYNGAQFLAGLGDVILLIHADHSGCTNVYNYKSRLNFFNVLLTFNDEILALLPYRSTI